MRSRVLLALLLWAVSASCFEPEYVPIPDDGVADTDYGSDALADPRPDGTNDTPDGAVSPGGVRSGSPAAGASVGTSDTFILRSRIGAGVTRGSSESWILRGEF